MNGLDIEVIRAETLTIPDQAKMIVIKDMETFKKGNDFFLIIKDLRKRIAVTFDPMEKAAKEGKQIGRAHV